MTIPTGPFGTSVSDQEVVTLVLTLAAVGFTIWKVRAIRLMPRGRLLLIPAGLIALSWLATVVEGLAFPRFFNALEHFSMLAAGIMLGVWIVVARRLEADA